MNHPRGDRVRASVQVALPPDRAFSVFTGEIDRWWRRGLRFRHFSGTRGIIHLEPTLGGRLFESFEQDGTTHVVQTGKIIEWAPPARLVFEWRNSTFTPDETTVVEVVFEPNARGTLVTVTHSGWSTLRPDHPARHGHPVDAFIRERAMWWSDLMTALRRFAADKGLSREE